MWYKQGAGNWALIFYVHASDKVKIWMKSFSVQYEHGWMFIQFLTHNHSSYLQLYLIYYLMKNGRKKSWQNVAEIIGASGDCT